MNGDSLLNPIVKWGQTESHVSLLVHVTPANDEKDNIATILPIIQIEEENVNVKVYGEGVSGRNLYGFQVDFYLPVIKEQSTWTRVARGIEITLKKEFKDPWPRLTHKQIRLPWLKFDFDKFQFNDSDASADEDLNSKMPAEQLAGIQFENRTRDLVLQRKNPLTLYLLLFNLVQFSGFLYIFGATVFLTIKHGFDEAPDYIYAQVIDQLKFVQGLACLEVFHACLGWVKGGGVLPTIMQVFGRNLCLFAMVVPHSELHQTTTFYWLIVAWSSIEIIRYPFYILSLIGEDWGLVTYLRYTLWIPMYPIGFMCEGKLILMAMPIVEEKDSYSLYLPNKWNVSFHFPTFIKIYLLAMILGFYMLMTHMYKRRKSRIGPNPKGTTPTFLQYLTQRSSTREKEKVKSLSSGNRKKLQ